MAPGAGDEAGGNVGCPLLSLPVVAGVVAALLPGAALLVDLGGAAGAAGHAANQLAAPEARATERAHRVFRIWM